MAHATKSAARLRIGYLVPEFPAQTHIFFWREILALNELGIDTALISTRRPPAGTVSHSWSGSAMSKTHYLLSANPFQWIGAALFLMRRCVARAKPLFRMLSDREYAGPANRLHLMVALLVASRLARFAHIQRLDHIHVGSCGRSALIAALGSILGGFTYSLSMLGPSFTTYGSRHKLKWRYAAFGLFQSKMLIEEGRTCLDSDFPRRYAHAPVGVDTERMQRSEPYRFWAKGDVCQIYSCGRLHPVKGHVDVIDAVCLLRSRGIDAQLRIGGEDGQGGSGYRRTIQQHIEERGASGFVHLLGAVSEEFNRLQYQSAHVYVMGSHEEAAGAVAAMEAMSMATPVVMCRAGATEELISHEIEGLLTEPRSAYELAAAIERVLFDPELTERIRNNGRKKIQAAYSHRTSANAIFAFLEEQHP